MRPSPSSVLDRDLEIRGGVPVTQTLRGGGVQETFFRPFGPQFGLKIRGRGIRHCSSFFHSLTFYHYIGRWSCFSTRTTCVPSVASEFFPFFLKMRKQFTLVIQMYRSMNFT